MDFAAGCNPLSCSWLPGRHTHGHHPTRSRGFLAGVSTLHQPLPIVRLKRRQELQALCQRPRPSDPSSQGDAIEEGQGSTETGGEGMGRTRQNGSGTNDSDVRMRGYVEKSRLDEYSLLGDVIANGPLGKSVSREEEALAAALLEENERRASLASEGGASSQSAPFLPRPAPGGASRETLERLAKARQYRQAADQRFAGSANDGGTISSNIISSDGGSWTAAGAAPAPLALSGDLQSQVPVQGGLPTVSSEGSALPCKSSPEVVAVASQSLGVSGAAQLPSPDTAPPSRAVGGAAELPARFLSKVVGDGYGVKMEEGMSMEQFTLMKEAEMKARGAEIITIGGVAAGSTDKAAEGYRPTVSTWGVFPRPQNISEAFGGGRNIKPGQELESEKDRIAREERVRTAMLNYRKNMGLDVDPEVERVCRVAFEEGMELLSDGRLKEACSKFDETIGGMALPTQLGGEARLQKAICLDSLGRSEEAYSLYRQIQRHPSGTVAKRAKRMLFGFEAAENLKAHTISYAPSKGAYEKYFRKLSSDWNSAYLPSEQDKNADLTFTTVVATAVMLSPILLVGVKVGAKLLPTL